MVYTRVEKHRCSKSVADVDSGPIASVSIALAVDVSCEAECLVISSKNDFRLKHQFKMRIIIPITRRRQLKRLKKSSILILNDLQWVRPEIWRKKQAVNITISWNTITNRIYIFLRVPPRDRIVLTLRELIWRTEFINFAHSFNVKPKKMLKWLKWCCDKDFLIF